MAVPWPNTGSNVEVADSQTFNRAVRKVSKFLIVYKLFIRMKIREKAVKKQI